MQMILRHEHAELFKQIIFQYGLHRPATFIEHYRDIDSLIARARFYETNKRAPPKPRAKKAKYQFFDSLEIFYGDESISIQQKVKSGGLLNRPGLYHLTRKLKLWFITSVHVIKRLFLCLKNKTCTFSIRNQVCLSQAPNDSTIFHLPAAKHCMSNC